MKIYFSHKEELWNSWSHFGGVVLGIGVGIAFLIFCIGHKNAWATLGVSLYLFGMLCSYIASTVYHALSARSVWKEKLRKWDHAAIYWHIAGSYSPLTLVALRQDGAWGWGLFIFIWTCAIVGTIMSFRKLKDHSNLETSCFVAMGLSILVAFKPLLNSVSAAAVIWIIAEGVHAQRVPLLCACRQHLSYHCCLGHADGISLSLYGWINKQHDFGTHIR